MIYRILKKIRVPKTIYFFCPYVLDWYIFEPVQKYLKKIPIVTNNPDVTEFFERKGTKVTKLPVFPKAVVMCRYAAYKFPDNNVIKIGLNHHAYHFKRLTNAKNYNMFNVYFMNSKSNVNEAIKQGVETAIPGGFPKLDKAFYNSISNYDLCQLRERLGFNNDKKVVLFTSTWVKSGMSALNKWKNKLQDLAETYNILVTIHPWNSKNDKKEISETPGVYLIPDEYTLPYIMISDFCVGDTSTILCECCALDKPLITFKTPCSKRSLTSTNEILDKISIRINDFSEIVPAIQKYISEPDFKKKERAEANLYMFDNLDGKAGKRVAEEIIKLLPELSLSQSKSE